MNIFSILSGLSLLTVVSSSFAGDWSISQKELTDILNKARFSTTSDLNNDGKKDFLILTDVESDDYYKGRAQIEIAYATTNADEFELHWIGDYFYKLDYSDREKLNTPFLSALASDINQDGKVDLILENTLYYSPLRILFLQKEDGAFELTGNLTATNQLIEMDCSTPYVMDAGYGISVTTNLVNGTSFVTVTSRSFGGDYYGIRNRPVQISYENNTTHVTGDGFNLRWLNHVKFDRNGNARFEATTDDGKKIPPLDDDTFDWGALFCTKNG